MTNEKLRYVVLLVSLLVDIFKNTVLKQVKNPLYNTQDSLNPNDLNYIHEKPSVFLLKPQAIK